MSVYDDVLSAVIELAETTQPYSTITLGSLPPDNGISITWGQTEASYNPFFNKFAAVELTAVLNGKHTDEQILSAALGKIHTALSMATEYPAADNYQITDISTINAPGCLGREENEQWLYGSSLRVKFYLRGI